MGSLSIPEHSLPSRAMLCSVSISMWSARKHDPEASEEIAVRHGAQADAGRYTKSFLLKRRWLRSRRSSMKPGRNTIS